MGALGESKMVNGGVCWCESLLLTQLMINRSISMSQSFWLFGTRLTILADHTTTKGRYDLIKGYFPPNTQTPLHRHTRYFEQLYVIEGEFTVWAGENKIVLKAGESFLIAPSIPHVVAVLGDRPARGLVVASPSGFARLIAEVGTRDQHERPDMERVEQISAEIGDEMLDPPGALPGAA
jgi:quercetin dioxygenase-like cupin family protein